MTSVFATPRPKGQRPKCRFCGLQLTPNFKTEIAGTRDVRVYRLREFGAHTRYSDESRWVTEDDDGAERDKKGRWFVIRTRPMKTRVFLGTYGYYGDDLFCGLNCGYRWARAALREGT